MAQPKWLPAADTDNMRSDPLRMRAQQATGVGSLLHPQCGARVAPFSLAVKLTLGTTAVHQFSLPVEWSRR